MRIFVRGAQYWVDVRVNGRRYREALGIGPLNADASQARQIALRRVDGYRKAPDTLIVWERLLHRWFTDRGAKRSIDRDRNFADYFSAAFSGKAIADISEEEIRDLLAKKRNETSAGNANHYLSFIRALFNHARELGWEAPEIRVKPFPSPTANRVRYLEREQLSRLLAELPPHLAAMVEFSVLTGLRQANVCGLRWDWLVEGVAVIPAEEAKNRAPMLVPLSARAAEIVESQRGRHPAYVFVYGAPGKRPTPISNPNNTAWRKALKRAGIENFRWHDTRHCFAAYHAIAGTPAHVLQQLGGWKNGTMVRRYAGLGLSEMRSYAERIGGTGKECKEQT